MSQEKKILLLTIVNGKVVLSQKYIFSRGYPSYKAARFVVVQTDRHRLVRLLNIQQKFHPPFSTLQSFSKLFQRLLQGTQYLQKQSTFNVLITHVVCHKIKKYS